MKRNRIRLSKHFWLSEFEDDCGWVMIHPSIIDSLETLWSLCAKEIGEDVEVIITGATLTAAAHYALGTRLGWTDGDPPGPVSRTSYHREEHGGVAVDFYVRNKRTKERLPQRLVGFKAIGCFNFVKDDYADGHIHGDNRMCSEAD